MIYKLYNPKTDSIFLSLYNNKKYELIEELEVPEDEEPSDYLELLLTEVDLGSMCEQKTKF